jgi:hypothetical protein
MNHKWEVIKSFGESSSEEFPIEFDNKNLWEAVAELMDMLLVQYKDYSGLRFTKTSGNTACSCHPEWRYEWHLEGIRKYENV